ncbi:MAG TPA: TolC family protein [Flavobacterium sp.]|nr:TolC family protein [Flavobacterium sp.]
MKKSLILLFFLTSIGIGAQNLKTLTLEQCWQLAEQNYPLSKKRELISKTREYTLENISKGYLPQFGVYAQATYQSDVTKIPIAIPGVEIPEQNKDQYKAYAEVNQLIYDGGVLQQQKRTEMAHKAVETQKLEVELYNLRERINALYFGILIISEQQKQNELLKDDINIGLKTTEAQIANGTSFRSNADLLKAELLKADQQSITLRNNKKAYLQMLGLFIGSEPDEETVLQKPEAPLVAKSINRPELELYNFQNESLELEKKTINAANLPRLNFFVQGGVGNPALNIFADGFDTYYVGGIRLNWSLSGLYTQKKQKAIIDLNKLDTETQREIFLFNTNQALQQQNAEITKLQEFLAVDGDIISLRNNVKKAALAQLQNGIINTGDYLREVNEENLALQNKSMHETELLLAQYREKTTRGN